MYAWGQVSGSASAGRHSGGPDHGNRGRGPAALSPGVRSAHPDGRRQPAGLHGPPEEAGRVQRCLSPRPPHLRLLPASSRQPFPGATRSPLGVAWTRGWRGWSPSEHRSIFTSTSASIKVSAPPAAASCFHRGPGDRGTGAGPEPGDRAHPGSFRTRGLGPFRTEGPGLVQAPLEPGDRARPGPFKTRGTM